MDSLSGMPVPEPSVDMREARAMLGPLHVSEYKLPGLLMQQQSWADVAIRGQTATIAGFGVSRTVAQGDTSNYRAFTLVLHGLAVRDWRLLEFGGELSSGNPVRTEDGGNLRQC